MTEFEEIEQRQRVLLLLLKMFFVVLLLAVCAIVGWLIAYYNYSERAVGAVLSPSTFVECACWLG